MVAKVQILRTSTPNQAPAALSPGELAIEMASVPPRLWVGVPTNIDAAGMKMLLPSAGGITVSEDQPTTPGQGDLWYESDTGILWMFYDDGTSQQWVQVNGGGGGGGSSVTVSDEPPATPEDGDLWFESDTGIFCVWYDDGTSAQWVQVNGISGGSTPPSPNQSPPAYGQCQLSVDAAGTTLTLRPYNGNGVVVDNTPLVIPAGGISLLLPAMTDNQINYVYLTPALALEVSPTGHSPNPVNGVEVMTGDPTRTLVGMTCNVNDTAGAIVIPGVTLSYFNRRGLRTKGVYGYGYSASAVGIEVAWATRAWMLNWGDEATWAAAYGTMWTDTAAGHTQVVNIVHDVIADYTNGCTGTSGSAGEKSPISMSSWFAPTEGLHWYNTLCAASANSAFQYQILGYTRG